MAEETTPNAAEEQASTEPEATATDTSATATPEPEAVNSEVKPTEAETDAAPQTPAAKKPPNPAVDGESAKPAAKRPPKAEAAADGDGTKPAAKAKKEKPPALEDKPFADFIQQDFLPALKAGLAKQDIQEVELLFEKRKINVIGFAQAPESWQVIGRWDTDGRQTREFSLYFFDESISGQKGFSYSESGGKASTLESFRIDERKVDLGLLVFWTLQRLNAQKWLVRN